MENYRATTLKKTLAAVITALLCGVFLAAWASNPNIGYTVLIPMLVSVAGLGGMILTAIVFAFSQRRRRSAGLLVAASLVFVGSFVSTASIIENRRSTSDYLVPIGPNVTADLVIVFRSDASDEEINDFFENVVTVRNPRGGFTLAPGVRSLLRVSLQGHQGFALQFHRDASASDVTSLTSRVSASKVVWQTFENVAPQTIRLKSPAN